MAELPCQSSYYLLPIFFHRLSVIFFGGEWKKLKKTSLVAFLGVSLISLCIINPVSAVGVFRNSEGNWYLDYNNTGITYKALHFGTKGDIPIIGDWNGDRIDGIAIFRPFNRVLVFRQQP